MYAFHRARFPTLLGIAWFRAGAMGTHVAGFFSLVVAFGFHTETPRPGERVLRLYTSENSQSDPHCLAPWKMVFLYQPVVFRVHGIVFQGVFPLKGSEVPGTLLLRGETEQRGSADRGETRSTYSQLINDRESGWCHLFGIQKMVVRNRGPSK